MQHLIALQNLVKCGRHCSHLMSNEITKNLCMYAYVCVCVCAFDFYLRGRQRVINILKHISEDFEPECAGLLNKSSFALARSGSMMNYEIKRELHAFLQFYFSVVYIIHSEHL